MLRPLKQSIRSIDILQLLLWIVAAMIIGSVIYLSALERGRDFAVMKATGSSSRSLLAGLSIQAILLSLAAAIVAIGRHTPSKSTSFLTKRTEPSPMATFTPPKCRLREATVLFGPLSEK